MVDRIPEITIYEGQPAIYLTGDIQEGELINPRAAWILGWKLMAEATRAQNMSTDAILEHEYRQKIDIVDEFPWHYDCKCESNHMDFWLGEDSKFIAGAHHQGHCPLYVSRYGLPGMPRRHVYFRVSLQMTDFQRGMAKIAAAAERYGQSITAALQKFAEESTFKQVPR